MDKKNENDPVSKSRGSNGDALTPRSTDFDSNAAVGLPSDPSRFWSAGVDLAGLESLPALDKAPALQRLGPLPFPRGGFPLMGFLATVYEHVANHVGRRASAVEESQPQEGHEENH